MTERSDQAESLQDAVKSSPWIQGASLAVIGLGIGWLTGLSVSPVVSGVVGSLVGIGVGIATGVRSVKAGGSQGSQQARIRIDARPGALLVLGIALGVTGGMLARNYRVFEPEWHRQKEERGRSANSTDTAGLEKALANLLTALTRIQPSPYGSYLFGTVTH